MQGLRDYLDGDVGDIGIACCLGQVFKGRGKRSSRIRNQVKAGDKHQSLPG